MRVHVKLFAILRERAGASEVVLHLRPGATVAHAADALGEKFPDLQTFLPRVAYALNESYAKRDTPLSEGDELALIPPVSGGCASKLAGYTKSVAPA
jgi:molybdopterin converting factor subunit 1